MKMKLSDLLIDESKWCQNNFAEDTYGLSVDPLDSEATSWCIVGAEVACEYTIEEKLDVIRAASGKVNTSLAAWQDMPERTFNEVRKFLLSIGH